jgi:hypothetical protein
MDDSGSRRSPVPLTRTSGGASAPAGVDLISVEDAAGALESLRHARDALGVREAICEIDAGSGRASLLRDAGGPVTPIDTSAKGRDDRRDAKSPRRVPMWST